MMTEQGTRVSGKSLRLKRRLRQRKPNFVRPESWRYVRLKENWRRPRGLDHKTRLKYDGWPPGAGIGYRSPKSTRGIHPSGYQEVLVYTIEDLKTINPKVQAIRIAHTVGKRKKARILAEAKKKRVRVLNVKETKNTAKEEEESAQEKLEEKEEIKEEPEESKKAEGKPAKRKKRTEKQ
ncbi:50S ribosomal protein L32e [Candidatus Bathyarchaeota archaeon]|nr:50S ribosomal protein L32e [Candidatus Bathyarchaeota archaeon]